MGKRPNSSRKGQSWATLFVAQLLLWHVLEGTQGCLGQRGRCCAFWRMAANGDGDRKGAGKSPNSIALELLAVKMAAHEASTGDGITGRGSLKEKTAVCYPRHLRLLCGEDGNYTWPQVAWTARGRNAVFTLEDSCAKRVQVDLWKLAGKNDAEIKKTYMVWFKEWLNDDGEIPSGQTLEDGAENVRKRHWQHKEDQRIETAKKKSAAALVAAPAADVSVVVATGLPPQGQVELVTVQATAVDSAPAPAPSRSPLGAFVTSVASSVASMVGIGSMCVVPGEDEEEVVVPNVAIALAYIRLRSSRVPFIPNPL